LFAACVVDIGGNFPQALLTPVANLPTVSLAPVELVLTPSVANLLPVSLIPEVHLELRISLQIFENF
jgi:hypothetical protein